MRKEFTEVNWGYAIRSNIPWIASFTAEFHSPDIRVYEDYEDDRPTDYIWSSIHLNEFTDERMIYERASALNAIFDGAMYVDIGTSYEPFWKGQLAFLSNGRAITNFEQNSLVEPFWQEYVDATPNQPEDFASKIIHKSRYDKSIREILLFLGVNGLSWISLYAVLDTIKSEGWSEKEIIAQKIATAAELNLFSHTANNVAAIGPFARHGNKGQLPPDNPMSLKTAKELILRILKKFIAAKL
jgi:hypothetical protein